MNVRVEGLTLSDLPENSRVEKYNKRRKNIRLIIILSVIGVVLLFVLLGIWAFGEVSNEDPSNASSETSANQTQNTEEKDMNKDKENERSSNEEKDDETMELDETDESSIKKEAVESTDENVVEAYTADWKPIGTKQEGPHTMQFDKSSIDWQEMVQAMELATGLPEADMTIHWLGRGGDQQAIGTISNQDNTEIYRVYLSWIDDQGWKPTRVEVLNEIIINQ